MQLVRRTAASFRPIPLAVAMQGVLPGYQAGVIKRSNSAVLLHRSPRGREAWITWDDSAQVYELFASADCTDYLGCFDSPEQALAWATRDFNAKDAAR